ncbi:hypothetical protein C8T65DRAFT_251016 [Cerioporus squamosus]|nr:hypothetical protein C8T65DRAFT_251016 [Cerioporus squamosus]
MPVLHVPLGRWLPPHTRRRSLVDGSQDLGILDDILAREMLWTMVNTLKIRNLARSFRHPSSEVNLSVGNRTAERTRTTHTESIHPPSFLSFRSCAYRVHTRTALTLRFRENILPYSFPCSSSHSMSYNAVLAYALSILPSTWTTLPSLTGRAATKMDVSRRDSSGKDSRFPRPPVLLAFADVQSRVATPDRSSRARWLWVVVNGCVRLTAVPPSAELDHGEEGGIEDDAETGDPSATVTAL